MKVSMTKKAHKAKKGTFPQMHVHAYVMYVYIF